MCVMCETIADYVERLNPEVLVKHVSAPTFGVCEAKLEISELGKEIRMGRFDVVKTVIDLASEMSDWEFRLKAKYKNQNALPS